MAVKISELGVEATTIEDDDYLVMVKASAGPQTQKIRGSNARASMQTFAGDATVAGNIVVGGLVDGRDIEADGTKLDGIEAAADVTDAANVASAGAVMADGSVPMAATLDFASNGITGLTSVGPPTGTSLAITADKAGADAIVINATNAAGGAKIQVADADVLAVAATGITVTGALGVVGLIGGGDGITPAALTLVSALAAPSAVVVNASDPAGTVVVQNQGATVVEVDGAGATLTGDLSVTGTYKAPTGQTVSVVGDKADVDAVVIDASGGGGIQLQRLGSTRLAVATDGNIEIAGALTVTGGVTSAPLLPLIESTTARALSATDNGRTIRCTHADGCAVTIPDTLQANFSCLLIQRGTGQVSVTGAGSMVLMPAATFDDSGTVRTAELGSGVCVVVESATVANAFGDLEAV